MTDSRVSLDLVNSALLSVGIHALFLVPGVSGRMPLEFPKADVSEGLSSVELEWVSSPAIQEEGEEQAPRSPRPPPEEWLQDSGAVSGSRLPDPVTNPAPIYPRTARLQGWEGTVLVRAWVTPTGGVAAARVAQSSGHGVLDDAALAALRQWRFIPARRRERTVASLVEVPVTFKLDRLKEEENP